MWTLNGNPGLAYRRDVDVATWLTTVTWFESLLEFTIACWNMCEMYTHSSLATVAGRPHLALVVVAAGRRAAAVCWYVGIR